MKKIVVLAFSFVAFLGMSASAQTKFGHASLEDIVSIMPEVRKLDTLLQKFKADSIDSQLPYYLSEYKRNDSIFKDPKTPAAVKAKVKGELDQYEGLLNNWQAYSQQVLEQKQQELLFPLYQKAMTAIQDVAKEGGYTYVFKQDGLLVAPPTDDLLPAVAKKLNIKIPDAKAAPAKPAGAPAAAPKK